MFDVPLNTLLFCVFLPIVLPVGLGILMLVAIYGGELYEKVTQRMGVATVGLNMAWIPMAHKPIEGDWCVVCGEAFGGKGFYSTALWQRNEWYGLSKDARTVLYWSRLVMPETKGA